MPLQNYFDRQLGSPMISGEEEELAAAENALLLGAIRMPWGRGRGGGGRGYGGGGMGLGMARRMLMQNWQVHPEMLRGESDEEIGADDEELGADEDVINDLSGDDDEIGGDTREELGATTAQIENKITKLHQRLAIAEAKLAATPAHRVIRRRRLNRHIAHLRKVIGKKEAKAHAKRSILAAKMGVPVAALAAGGAAVYGLDRARVAEVERAGARGAAYAATGEVGRVSRSPRSGIEQRIAFQDATGAQVQNVSIVAGAGVRTAQLTWTTPLIPYADFSAIGVDVKVIAIQANAAGVAAGFPANELLIDVSITSLVIGGDINLYYTPQDAMFGAQSTANGLSNSRTIAGLRANSYMEKNNTAVLIMVVRQEITNTTTISVAAQCALVVDVAQDNAARRAV